VTDRAIVDVMRDLARVQPDQHIARVLNRLGYRTGAGNTWTEHRALSLRRYQQIPAFDRTADRRDTLTIADAAAALGMSATTVRRLMTLGLLPATQPVLYAPWVIRREDLEGQTVQRAVALIKPGRTLPRTPDERQGAREGQAAGAGGEGLGTAGGDAVPLLPQERPDHGAGARSCAERA